MTAAEPGAEPGAKAGKPSDLPVRAAAGLAMIAVAMLALVVGGLLFWLLAVVAGLFMMAEWSDLHATPVKAKRIALFSLSVPLAIMAPIAAGPNFFALGLLAGAAFFSVIVTRRPSLALGTIYVGLPVLALLLLRHQHEGIVWTLWALALVWATDIGAYFAGRAVGGPKLAPRISPAKTWAGLGGGVVLAGLLGATMHAACGLPWRMTLATPFLAILAQGGDLYESWLKRRAGVKDSGSLIPGHGGVLDRLDGVVPVAPVAAFLAILPTILAWLT